MFLRPAPYVNVSVADHVDVDASRAVRLERVFTFATRSEEVLDFQWHREERLGVPFNGSISAPSAQKLRIWPSRAGDADPEWPFSWEIDGQTSDQDPFRVSLACLLRAASSMHPLTYLVLFDTKLRVDYSLTMVAAYGPGSTASSRFQWVAEPSALSRSLTRAASGGLVTSGVVSISANQTGPVRVEFTHAQVLRSTRLMAEYGNRFA